MAKSASWWVNVNKHKIARNIRSEEKEPPIRISRGKHGSPTYCSEVELPAGSVVVYDADNPLLPCGARLAIRCPEEPKIIR